MAREKLSKAEIVENIFPLVKVSKKNIHKIIDLFFDQIKTGLLGTGSSSCAGWAPSRFARARAARPATRRPVTPWSLAITVLPISGQAVS